MGSTGIHVTLAEVDERAAIATNRLVNRFNQDVAAIDGDSLSRQITG
ncbi:MAG TPA: hypothetical protein PLN56_08665 [Methanoregulaceae archaeon]|nr:hypothetical protein [Methanoregulaceae archaeon]HRT16129.1 hypothetical protein [Methanoregulaceae archaeon]HRU31664.1 hypothetical protein [Methanoregulaceae archaeon]